MRPTGRCPHPLGCLACADALALAAAHPPRPDGSDHGIFISVEGLGAGLLRDLIENDLAGDDGNFRRFGYEGATAFDARSHYTHNIMPLNHMTFSIGWAVQQPVGHLNTVHHHHSNP